MIGDLRTVIWKEWKDFIGQRSTLLGVAVYLGMFGVFLPHEQARRWVDSPAGVAQLVLVPVFLVLTVIADAFAGERERHTLDTLLASRLPDRAILFGKLAAVVAYGWSLTVTGMVASLITANASDGRDGWHAYPAEVTAGVLAFSLLGIVLVSSAGLLVSLRAPTVRAAQQILNVAVMLLGLAVIGGIAVMPESLRGGIQDALAGATPVQIAVATGALLAAIDALVIAAAIARFQRTRLVLD